jgi:ParB family chromosome partitioning protein
MDDEQVLQIALIENLQRQDLNAIEEAKGYQKLMDEFSYSPEQIGDAVGRSRSHVSNMARLLHLPTSVQDMVIKGDLSAGHARALINAPNPALLAQEVVQKGLSVRQTEQFAASSAGRDVQKRPAKGKDATFKDPNLLALERDLTNALGLKVLLDMSGDNAGTVKIDFKSLDQLDDVIARLSKAPH